MSEMLAALYPRYSTKKLQRPTGMLSMYRPEICLQFFVYNPVFALYLIFIFVPSYSSGVRLC